MLISTLRDPSVLCARLQQLRLNRHHRSHVECRRIIPRRIPRNTGHHVTSLLSLNSVAKAHLVGGFDIPALADGSRLNGAARLQLCQLPRVFACAQPGAPSRSVGTRMAGRAQPPPPPRALQGAKVRDRAEQLACCGGTSRTRCCRRRRRGRTQQQDRSTTGAERAAKQQRRQPPKQETHTLQSRDGQQRLAPGASPLKWHDKRGGKSLLPLPAKSHKYENSRAIRAVSAAECAGREWKSRTSTATCCKRRTSNWNTLKVSECPHAVERLSFCEDPRVCLDLFQNIFVREQAETHSCGRSEHHSFSVFLFSFCTHARFRE